MFDAVVGHAAQRELLARAIERGAIHPAYLFSGPPGVGKRLVAHELARALLCAAGTPGACGACASCHGLGRGAHPDFLVQGWEEGKKSIGVKAVRAVTEWLLLSPAPGSRRVAIIEPAEDLTDEAANALLKTLEEPPPRRVVVLVAGSAGALPATVRSRCQHVPFGALTDEEVAAVLRRAGWPAQAARQAAALAEGSPGAALARDGKSWIEGADAVRAALEDGGRGGALALAERLGESRERVLLALEALLGMLRQAARRRLGAGGGGEPPEPLSRLGAAGTARLLALALETHRRLAGDRPPNAKLALSTVLLGCLPAQPDAPVAAAPRGRGGGR